VGGGKIRTKMNHGKFHDKGGLWSVGTANKKIGRVAPLMLSRGLMREVVTCPGLGEVDKRGHPRVPTHHPLVFQNQQS